MANPFSQVPAIRETQKYCGLSLSSILSKISGISKAPNAGRFDHRFSVDVEIDGGSQISVLLRWAMLRRNVKPHNWAMSLLLNDRRIDCIDHEWTVLDHRGYTCTGWHRHVWDPATQSCEVKKECLTGFGPFTTFSEFVVSGCSTMAIKLEEEDPKNESSASLFSD